MHIRRITVVVLVSVLFSCRSTTQIPLPTDTLQPALVSMMMELPVTSTPENIPAVTPMANPNLGTPVPDWKGVPVMPEANKGEVKPFGYVYWASITAEEAETFYLEQMTVNGWPLVNDMNVLSWYGRGKLLQFRQEYSNEIIDILFVADSGDQSLIIVLKKYVYIP